MSFPTPAVTPQPTLGSMEWVQQTGGILRRSECIRLIGRTYCCVMPVALVQRVRAIWWRRHPSVESIACEFSDQPQSRFAMEAEVECNRLLSPSMVHHSYRTWAFGCALAEVDGAPVDIELLFVAAMLHDVGLAQPTFRTCFTLRGAELVAQLGGSHGRAARTDVANAITHHITPGLTPSEGGTLGFYLQAGSALDLGGLRVVDLPLEFVSNVCDRWPLDDIKREAGARWRAESAMVKHGRAHLLERWARFSLLSRLTPLPPTLRR